MTATEKEIEDRVRAAMRSDRRLGAGFRLARIEQAADGTLTLEGEVDNVAQKKIALERAAAVDGVAAIADRISVTPASTMGDREIRARLRDYFIQEPAFSDYAVRQLRIDEAIPAKEDYELLGGDPATARAQIDIEVRNGIVTLSGRVPGLASKRLAGVMAWWVPGARDVINGLAVEPPEDDAPIRIEEAVRLVLDRDPLVDDTQIRVGVRHRTVRLTGAVPSKAIRGMAERDAWCVFGVDDVVNEIVVAI
ncbi:BON domain-containing protein [Ostreiculturibacter nitratireducens]|uniref:BON domain-containing protein n=1 Tax=Ostreiculturibacter nitratireducens TaxID=3075226 RepID=UPI0031B5B2FD